jgi:hypothetical protein
MKASFLQRKALLDQRLEAARKNERTKQIAALEQQQQQMIEQAKNVARKNGLADEWQQLMENNAASVEVVQEVPKSQDAMTDERASWIAENAYLRTLSRKPKAHELATSIAYLKSEADPVKAVEGLMWGLINTKEFILNH